MTARDAIHAIEPGSTESGSRAALESGLQDLLGQRAPAPEGGPGAPAAGAPDTAGLGGSDPLSAMLGGVGDPGSSPGTSGMSVGAGPGPVEDSPMMSDRANRLRAIAESAATPSVRYAAAMILKRMSGVKEKL